MGRGRGNRSCPTGLPGREAPGLSPAGAGAGAGNQSRVGGRVGLGGGGSRGDVSWESQASPVESIAKMSPVRSCAHLSLPHRFLRFWCPATHAGDGAGAGGTSGLQTLVEFHVTITAPSRAPPGQRGPGGNPVASGTRPASRHDGVSEKDAQRMGTVTPRWGTR